jgi:hypothetical protein
LHLALRESKHRRNKRISERAEVGTPRAYEDVTQDGPFYPFLEVHMAEHDPNDELSVEELEDVAGGTDVPTNGTCPNAGGHCSGADREDA